MLSIYEYSSPQEFLRDRWKEKKKRNAAFSLRAWSRQLGLDGHAPLHLMLAGRRPIPKKYVPRLIETLQLSPREGLYLETLIDLSRARDARQKELYLSRLHEISPREPVRLVELESFRMLGDPVHMAILEMTGLRGFKLEPAWIQSRLVFSCTLSRISEAVDRLIALGLLHETTQGRWVKTNRHISNRPDVADKGSQEYHRNVSALAADMVTGQPVHEREYNGYAFNINKSSLPLAKKLIREFARAFMEQVECRPDEPGDSTYQLNIQFFSLTKGDRS